jgi:hypothetical protein
VTPAWWTGLTPLEETVPCGDAHHRLRWSDGELATPDHDDPDGERTLGALGGQPIPCIEILDAWHRHRADLDVLLLAGRGTADPLDPQVTAAMGGAQVPTPMSRPWYYGGGPGPRIAAARPAPPRPMPPGPPRPMPAPLPMPPGPPAAGPFGGGSFGPAVLFPGPGGGGRRFVYYGESQGDPLSMLLRLPGALADRLVATVVATWAQRIADHDPRVTAALPALHAALYGRVLAAVRGWLGGGHKLDVRLAATPAVARGADGVIGFELPFSWLSDVWARGFTTLAGDFCLTARPGRSGDWTFTTVAPDLGEPRNVTLHAW